MSIKDNIRVGFLPREGFETARPEDICRDLSAIGYQAVEWSRHHFNPRTKTPAELKQLVTIAAEHDMAVSDIFVALDYVTKDEKVAEDHIQWTIECIQAAAEIGVHTINCHPGPQRWEPNHVRIPEDMSEAAAWDMAFHAYDQIVPVAEKYKVYLAVEGVWGMVTHDYYTTLPLMNRYDSEYMAITMDPSHGNLWRNNIPWVIQQWNKKIKHAHLKDSVGTPGYDGDTFIFPILGEGQVDWNGYFTAMNDIDYQGYYIVEFESFFYFNQICKGNMLQAAKLSWDCVQALLASLEDKYE